MLYLFYNIILEVDDKAEILASNALCCKHEIALNGTVNMYICSLCNTVLYTK